MNKLKWMWFAIIYRCRLYRIDRIKLIGLNVIRKDLQEVNSIHEYNNQQQALYADWNKTLGFAAGQSSIALIKLRIEIVKMFFNIKI